MPELKIRSEAGMYKKAEKDRNREAILKWFMNNPGTSKKDCQKGTGLSYQTVLTHIKEIEEAASNKRA